MGISFSLAQVSAQVLKLCGLIGQGDDHATEVSQCKRLIQALPLGRAAFRRLPRILLPALMSSKPDSVKLSGAIPVHTTWRQTKRNLHSRRRLVLAGIGFGVICALHTTYRSPHDGAFVNIYRTPWHEPLSAGAAEDLFLYARFLSSV
jgi:hypothetical protein